MGYGDLLEEIRIPVVVQRRLFLILQFFNGKHHMMHKCGNKYQQREKKTAVAEKTKSNYVQHKYGRTKQKIVRIVT